LKNTLVDPYPSNPDNPNIRYNPDPYPTEKNTPVSNPKFENKKKEKIEYMSYYDHFLQPKNLDTDNYKDKDNIYDNNSDSNTWNHSQYSSSYNFEGKSRSTKKREYLARLH
jgi:hypothetical protein